MRRPVGRNRPHNSGLKNRVDAASHRRREVGPDSQRRRTVHHAVPTGAKQQPWRGAGQVAASWMFAMQFLWRAPHQVLVTSVAPESLLRRPAGNSWGKLVNVFQKLYIRLMTRSATLPPIRVAPETKARLEAVLREGESLTQFIEGAVCREAEFRAEQNAAMARAKVALRSAAKGMGLLSAEDFLAGMTQRAHKAQQRIREATAAKSKRTAG